LICGEWANIADFESIRQKHRKDSILALSFFIFFLLLFLFDDYFISISIQAVKNPDNLFSVEGHSWVKFLTTIIIPFVTYFIGILTIAKRDFYYNIDNRFFKRRQKVDTLICTEMLNFRNNLAIDEQKKIEDLKKRVEKDGKSNLLMGLFYKYIEKTEIVNPELKNQAFIYWGDYFSSITFTFFGICSLIIAFLIVFVSPPLTSFRLVILLIIVFFIVLNLDKIFRGKNRQKLFEIPKTQIDQIHRNDEQSLLKELKSENFGINHETSY